MEDVDKIIMHSLRQIGCELEEDIKSIGQFNTEIIVEATARCLKAINPEIDAPLTMPPSMSVRFRIGASLAQACQDLGYKGEIGYQTFLYSTESDIRKVFMFLIELLPKDSEKLPDIPMGKTFLQKQRVAQVLRHQLSKPWLPLKCRKKGISNLEGGVAFVDQLTLRTQPFDSVSVNLEQPITSQLSNISQLVPTLIELNAKKADCSTSVETSKEAVDWSSVFAMEKPAIVSKVKPVAQEVAAETSVEEESIQDEKDVAKSDEIIVGELQEEVSDLMTQIENIHMEARASRTKVTETWKKSEALDAAVKRKDERLMTERKVLKLLPEAEANLLKLEDLVNEEIKKLLSLGTKWDKHRGPLVEQYRELRSNSTHMSEAQMQAEIARSVEEKIGQITTETKEKEELHARLRIEFENLSKDISRSSYTRRIFEIIGNIDKQRGEISKVLADTRNVQKDINQLTGRVDRSFAVTDEMIFKDAKRDETARNAYKLLATLHSDCAKLVKLVEETGCIVREIRELEDQIETENSKNITANLERITADLMQMRQESAVLAAQLKSSS